MNWPSLALLVVALSTLASLAQGAPVSGTGAVLGPFKHRVISGCQPISPADADTPMTAINQLHPAAEAAIYVGRKGPALLKTIRTARTQVLLGPQHGTVTEGFREGSAITYIYRPNYAFSGYDAVTFAVNLARGARVLVVIPVIVGGDERFPPGDCHAKLPRVN